MEVSGAQPDPDTQPISPLTSDGGLSVDIERAMDTLPEDCRAVVILCLAYGFSHREAAKATKLPLGTVKSYCARGKSKLRAFLSAYETT